MYQQRRLSLLGKPSSNISDIVYLAAANFLAWSFFNML